MLIKSVKKTYILYIKQQMAAPNLNKWIWENKVIFF